jgi:hypothetical protein
LTSFPPNKEAPKSHSSSLLLSSILFPIRLTKPTHLFLCILLS